MAIIVPCPECRQSLQMPEAFAGKTVRCPDCKHSFTAMAPSAPTVPTTIKPPSLPPPLPPPLPDDFPTEAATEEEEYEQPIEEADEDQPRKRKRGRSRSSGGGYFEELTKRQRKIMSPHRGVMVLVFGILSVVCSVGPLIGLIFGALAYQMGTNDLNEIYSGRMHPDGESLTKAGRIIGVVGVCLSVGLVVLNCCLLAGVGPVQMR